MTSGAAAKFQLFNPPFRRFLGVAVDLRGRRASSTVGERFGAQGLIYPEEALSILFIRCTIGRAIHDHVVGRLTCAQLRSFEAPLPVQSSTRLGKDDWAQVVVSR